MTEKEMTSKAVSTEAVNEGVGQAFKGVGTGEHIDEQVGTTVEVAGVAAEAEDLDATVDKLNKKIKHTKIASIIVWLACAGLFIGRFIL